jgi:2-polyprenyl-3-methyl-5-hydroxy-6-metoxy-1,4-benzoquinol methylase
MAIDPYQITFETWNKVAYIYQDKFMDLDLYNATYDSFCDLITKPNASILEIACGPGNITKYLLNKRPDYQILATDVAPNMIELAKQNCPTADFKIMDCRELHTITEKYDGIMCGFCMPYLSKEDCAKFITDASNLLNKHGVIYFSTIEGNYDQSGFEAGSSGDKSYVYYHQADYLQQQLNYNDFELIELERILYPKTANVISTHLIFIARKK